MNEDEKTKKKNRKLKEKMSIKVRWNYLKEKKCF